MKPDEPSTDWLAREIFKAYPHDCPGLKIYVLDCGCLYYRRIFRDGTEDDQIGIYRNPAHGPCEVCMTFPKDWGRRVIDEVVAYNTGVRIQESGSY